jgi:ribonucleoside-diphosphate reductase alpha chain
MNWAELYSLATKDIVQQGGSRRGALMLMIQDWHPDIEEFITVKQDLTKINGANLSVCISDAFMAAVKKDADWDLVYPDIQDPKYDELWDGDLDMWKKKGGKVTVHKTVKARYLWDMICQAAWRSAEPGLHFLERSNKRSNTWYFERLIATNPCGEQPLGAWAVCNLGAMNLLEYVKNEKFDFKSFAKDVKVAMRFLDNVIDETYYFFKENEEVAKDIRRTGLGIMGLADALIQMKLRYGSKESLKVVREIFKTLRDNAYESSSDTAAEKGSFPHFDNKKYMKGYHIKALPKALQEKIKKQGIRNAVLLTIAPTGTTSLLAGVSSGVEPVYEFSFTRRDRTGEHEILHPLYEEWKKQHPNAEKPSYFVSANDLTPMEHAEVQAVAQEYIDSSISKTVNAPNHHKVEDVKELYMAAYDLGLKGVTYMRDGSRAGVLERKPEVKKEEAKVLEPVAPTPVVKERPMVVHGSTYRIQTPVGTAFITINTDGNGDPLEIFINVGKAGSDVYAMATGLGRVISLALRFTSHLPTEQRIKELIDQLCDIGGARTMGFGKERVRSLPDAVAKVLEMHYTLNSSQPEKEVRTVLSTTQEALPLHATASDVLVMPKKKSNFDICPKCGEAAFVYEEGCKKCYSCAYSEC